MSARLSKELREKYNVKTLPIHKDDEVMVVSGKHKKTEGKVTGVRYTKYRIYIERITRTKANGQQVMVPIHPSKVIITKLSLNKNREELLKARKEKRERMLARKEKEIDEIHKLMEKEYPELDKDITLKKEKNEKKKAEKQGLEIINVQMGVRLMDKETRRKYEAGKKRITGIQTFFKNIIDSATINSGENKGSESIEFNEFVYIRQSILLID